MWGRRPLQETYGIRSQRTITRVNVLSLLGVFLVVMASFRSLLVPALVIIPIEARDFPEYGGSLPGWGHHGVYGLHYCEQHSAGGHGVDYSILLANNYVASRENASKAGCLYPGADAVLLLHIYIGHNYCPAGYIIYFISSTAPSAIWDI